MTQREKEVFFTGIFVGEGCAHISRTRSKKGDFVYHACLNVTMGDEVTVRWIQANFGGNLYRRREKGLYAWDVHSKKTVLAALKILLKHTLKGSEKYEQIKSVMVFCSLPDGRSFGNSRAFGERHAFGKSGMEKLREEQRQLYLKVRKLKPSNRNKEIL